MVEKSTDDYYWPFTDTRKPTYDEFASFLETYQKASKLGERPLEHYRGPSLKELCNLAGVKTSACGRIMGISQRSGYRRLKRPETIHLDEYARLCWALIDKSPSSEVRETLASWLFNIDAGISVQNALERIEDQMRDAISEIAYKLSGENLRSLYKDAIGIEAISEIELRTVIAFPITGDTHISADNAGALLPTIRRVSLLSTVEQRLTKSREKTGDNLA